MKNLGRETLIRIAQHNCYSDEIACRYVPQKV
jgi:hypothetical protein